MSWNTNIPDNYPDCLIIERPDLKSKSKWVGESVLTLFFWGFWFYLWLPLISLIAWWLGFQFFYYQMLELGGLTGFIDQLHVFASGVGFFSMSISGWSIYNLRKYGSRTRRKGSPGVDKRKLSTTFSLPEDILKRMQKAKLIAFSFRENDSFEEVGLLAGDDAAKGQLVSYKENGTTISDLGFISWLRN